MVSIGLKVLWVVGLDVHEYGNDLWMQTQDISLNPTSDGVTFGDRRGLGDLQMEIDLKAIAQTTSPESMETLRPWGGQDVLTEVLKHRLFGRGINEVQAGALEEADTFGTEPTRQDEPDDFIDGDPFWVDVGDDDGHEGEERSNRICSVVGGISHEQARAEALSLAPGKLIKDFLNHQGRPSDPSRSEFGLLDGCTGDESTQRLPSQTQTEQQHERGDE